MKPLTITTPSGDKIVIISEKSVWHHELKEAGISYKSATAFSLTNDENYELITEEQAMDWGYKHGIGVVNKIHYTCKRDLEIELLTQLPMEVNLSDLLLILIEE